MAHPAPEIAFVINDSDYVLAHCDDQGIGDALASVSREDPNAFDQIRDALRANGFEIGQVGLIFVPYEMLTHFKLRRKDLEDSTLEAETYARLDQDPDNYEIDFGEATKTGRFTPVVMLKTDLSEAAKLARNAGITPLGLSTLFPSNIRSPQPFFRIESGSLRNPSASSTRQKAGLIAAGIAVFALATVTLTLWTGLVNLPTSGELTEITNEVEDVSDETSTVIASVPLPADPSLYPMLRAPFAPVQGDLNSTLPIFVEAEALKRASTAPDLETSVSLFQYSDALPDLETAAALNAATNIEEQALADALAASEPIVFSDEDSSGQISASLGTMGEPNAALLDQEEEFFEFVIQTPEAGQPRPNIRPYIEVPPPILTPLVTTPRPRAKPAQIFAAAQIRRDEEIAQGTSIFETSIPTVRPAELAIVRVPTATESASVAAVVSTTSAGAEDAATTRGRVLTKNELSLIGVFGRSNSREAMFRTSGGRFVTKSMGESINTWKIVAIGANEVTLARGSKTMVLVLPN